MRMYTDSADAIKAYAEEVKFDLSLCDEVNDIAESSDSRGGLEIKLTNYHDKPMTITVHHTWMDLFDITFYTEGLGAKTMHDQYFGELMHLFKSLKVAMTGVNRQDWLDKMREEE